RMKINVHRAASVFTPRSVVVVNPPSIETLRSFEDAGGGARALEWVLEGMPGESMLDGKPTAEGLRRQLAASGLDAATIERMVAVAATAERIDVHPEMSQISGDVAARSEEQAM